MKQLIFCLLAMSVLWTSCKDIDLEEKRFGIFQVQSDNTTVVASGVINSNSLDHFNALLSYYPDVKVLLLEDMPGSADDEVNVQLGRAVYGQAMDTHINDNFDIASGAVDLFLAGRKRTKGMNTRIGVHAWSDGKKEASDYAEDAPEHDLFIDYYKAVGHEAQWAKDFYFFTINAAIAADIHWMTEAEIEEWNVLTE